MSLKFKPKNKGLKLSLPEQKQTEVVEEPKKTKRQKSTLPADTYRDEFEPIRMKVSDSMELVLSVQRKGDLGLPHFDIRMFATTERYTGPTKQGFNMSVDKLTEFSQKLQDLCDKCEEKELFEEFEE